MLIAAAGSLAIAFVVVVWSLPRSTLLPTALAVTVLLPVGRLPVPEALTVLGPGAFVVLVWTLRRERHGRARAPVVMIALGVTCLVWTAVSLVLGISLVRSAGWSVAFGVLVLLPALDRRLAPDEARAVLRTWTTLSVVLAVFGVVERLLRANPLYGWVWRLGDHPILQYWSDYRITTSLGHPLNNALFFAVGTSLAVGAAVERGGARPLVAAALSLVGVFLTISRGGLLAVAVGVAVVVLGPVGRRAATDGAFRRRVAAGTTVGLGLALVALSPVFQDRWASSNGMASARARDALGPLVWAVSTHQGHLGSGPGTSNALLERLGTPTIVENSWFQLLLSLGLPGVVLVAGLVVTAVVVGLRGRAVAAAAGLGALATAAAGFNWIESDRPGMLYLGLLLAAALAAPVRDGPPPPRYAPADSARIASGSDESRKSDSRSGSPGSSIASAARRRANSARSTPRFGSCDHGTGPAPRQPAFRRASSPRW